MTSTPLQVVPMPVQNTQKESTRKADVTSNGSSQFDRVLNKRMEKQTASTEKTSKKDSVDTQCYSSSKANDISSNQTNNGQVTNNMNEVLQEVSEEIKNTLMNELGITEEQLEFALETIGLTMIDLLNQNNLTTLFLQVNDIQDISSLLTDELLGSKHQNLIDLVNQCNPLLQMQLTSEEMQEMVHAFKEYVNADESSQEVVEVSQSDNVEEIKFVEESEVTNVDAKEAMKDENRHMSDDHPKKQTETNEVHVVVNGQAQITTQTKVEFMDQLAPTIEAREIVDQIVKEIKVTISKDQTSMEMVLTPDTLGKVNLTVTSKDGVMTAHMITETTQAKEAIENQMNLLKETLDTQGLKVEEVEVTVAANSFDFMNQSQTSQEKEEYHQNIKKVNGKNGSLIEDVESQDDMIPQETSNINVSIGKGLQIDLTA